MENNKIIKIGNYNFKVLLIKEDDFAVQVDDVDEAGEMFLGYYRRDERGTPCIYINKDLVKTAKYVTFAHEVLEATNDTNDLKLTHTQISVLSEAFGELFLKKEQIEEVLSNGNKKEGELNGKQ